MTLIGSRLEALVAARVGATGPRLSLDELARPLERFAPVELTPAAWRERMLEVVSELRAQGVLDTNHRLHDAGELARRIGRHGARTWRQLADRVLPGLGLGIAADDSKVHARLAGRDASAAAIIGRTLALWVGGSPLSLPAVCDALAWRELGLPGKPKPCPAEIRALFLQRQLRSDAGPPERLVRVLAAREVGAPRPELKALLDALVRGWLAGRTLGAPPTAAAEPPAFASDALRAAGSVQVGRFGDRKVFVSAVWDELRKAPPWSELTLPDLKTRLVAAHRAGELELARADLVAAMDPELVAASEIIVDGASFHFLVKEPVS